jgi:DNA-directed RNA polymerase specialized sigma24 family protein
VRGWLYVVALHEGYRLAGIDRRELHIADLSPDLARDTRLADRVSLDDQLEARDALRALAQLPEHQRRDLTLLVAGFSYRDITQMTGGRTYTNVNKHLAKARAPAVGSDVARNGGHIGSAALFVGTCRFPRPASAKDLAGDAASHRT